MTPEQIREAALIEAKMLVVAMMNEPQEGRDVYLLGSVRDRLEELVDNPQGDDEAIFRPILMEIQTELFALAEIDLPDAQLTARMIALYDRLSAFEDSPSKRRLRRMRELLGRYASEDPRGGLVRLLDC